jgi:hypothetical protein
MTPMHLPHEQPHKRTLPPSWRDSNSVLYFGFLPLLEFELLPWLVDVFSMVNLSSTEIKRLARDAHHFCRQVHGRNLHRNKFHGI